METQALILLVLLTAGIQLVINSFIFFFTMKVFTDTEEVTIGKCILRVFLMTIFMIVVFFGFALLPNCITLIAALVVGFIGCKAIIEGIFEMTSGGGGVLLVYIIVNMAIGYILKSMNLNF